MKPLAPPARPHRRWVYVGGTLWALGWSEFGRQRADGKGAWLGLALGVVTWVVIAVATLPRHRRKGQHTLVALAVLLGLTGAFVAAPPEPPAQAATVVCHNFSYTQPIYDIYANANWAIATLTVSGRACGYSPGGLIPSQSYVIANVEDTSMGSFSHWHTWSRGVANLGIFPYSDGGSYEVGRVYLAAHGCFSVVCTATGLFHVSFRLVKPKYLTPYFIWTTGLVAENSAGAPYHFYR